MLVDILIRPLPHVSYQVHHAISTRASGMGIDIVGLRYRTPFRRYRYSVGFPAISPWIDPRRIATLRRILPLPLMREPLAGPLGIGPSIFERDPGYRLVSPALRKGAVSPVAEKVQTVGWLVM